MQVILWSIRTFWYKGLAKNIEKWRLWKKNLYSVKIIVRTEKPFSTKGSTNRWKSCLTNAFQIKNQLQIQPNIPNYVNKKWKPKSAYYSEFRFSRDFATSDMARHSRVSARAAEFLPGDTATLFHFRQGDRLCEGHLCLQGIKILKHKITYSLGKPRILIGNCPIYP